MKKRTPIFFNQLDPLVLTIPLGPFYMGWVFASGTMIPRDPLFYLAAMAIFPFLSVGTILLNDSFDLQIDIISARKSRFGHSLGMHGQTHLLNWAFISFSLAIIISFFVSPAFLGLVAGLVGVSIMYSAPPLQLSRKGGLDILSNMLGIGVLCCIGGWIIERPWSIPPPQWLMVSALGTGAFFIFPALMDHESDERAGKHTTIVHLDWMLSCGLGLSLITFANLGIVYMSLGSILLYPSFLEYAWPFMVCETLIFPLVAMKRMSLSWSTAAMTALLFIGNLLILFAFTGQLT